MKTSNATQSFSTDDPVWVLLADLSLGDFSSDDRRDGSMAGYLFPMVRELGMPLECVENIAVLVSEFAREPSVHYKQEGLEFPARMRIFCQKKILDDAKAARANSRTHHTDQAMEHSPMIPDLGTKISGGWGCFLIKRGSNVSDVSLSADNFVDLYLYREG